MSPCQTTCPWCSACAGPYRSSPRTGGRIMSTSANVATLLQHLVTLPDICLVIGSHEAIGEVFVDPATMDFRVDGTSVTMENGPWHIHLDAAKVHKIMFVVTPDTAHNSTQLSYSVRFFDAHG